MLFFLLAGFIIALLSPLIHKLGGKWSGLILALFPSSIFIYFINRFIAQSQGGDIIIQSNNWIPSLSIDLLFFLDGLALLFVLIISGFGILIILYSRSYLKDSPQLGRFYGFLIFFMTSMIGLPIAGNLITLFLFWELTSISSFLLISFDHEKEESRKSAKQAFLITSLGAMAMLMGFIFLGEAKQSYNIHEILQSTEIYNNPYKNLIMVLLLLGAFTKSAQFPFHFWLPNAMAAPTPVSAYLHSATMVKAGIYLVARFNPIFGNEIVWKGLLIVIGTITMALGAFLALNKTDLKKILAYTTISALGIIFLMLGLGTAGAVQAALIFMIAHAFYKGTLFLMTGNVDHETGSRDLSQLSGLRRSMPFTATATVLACLSMSGMIPFVGFIGKELLLDAIIEANIYTILLLSSIILSSAIFTAVAIKIAYGIFFGKFSSVKTTVHESPLFMVAAPLVLSIGGLLFGLIPEKLLQPLLNLSAIQVIKDAEVLHLSLWHGFNLVLFLSVATLLLGIVLYNRRNFLSRAGAKLKLFSNQGSTSLFEKIIQFILISAYRTTRIIQNGYLRIYFVTILTFFISIVLYILYRHSLSLGISFSSTHFSHQNLYEWIIALFIILGIAKSLISSSRVTALASMGVVGYGLALVFIIYSAPDAAMTQFLIETLTVVLFVLVLHKLPHFENLSGKTINLIYLFIALSFGAMMSYIVLLITSFPMQSEIKSFIVNNSYTLAHGRNMVNVILVDFRAMDTLGESIVLAIAATGIYSLLKLKVNEKEENL